MTTKFFYTFFFFGLSVVLCNAQQCVAPLITYNTNHTLCELDATPLVLTAHFTAPYGCIFSNPLAPYTWNGPSGVIGTTMPNNFTILSNASNTGSYSVQVTLMDDPAITATNCPCMGTQTSNTIFVKPKPQLPNVNILQSGCVGESAVLQGVSISNFPNPSSYEWYDSGQNSILYSGNPFSTMPLNSGLNTFKVRENYQGCFSNYQTINVLPAIISEPLVTIDTLHIYCNNFATLQATPDGVGMLYWYNSLAPNSLIGIGNSVNTPLLNASQNYIVIAKNGNCESTPKTVRVEVIGVLAPSFSGDDSFCNGEEVSFMADNATSTGTAGVFEWYNAPSGGSLLYSGNPFVIPSSMVTSLNEKIYVRQTIQGCSSPRFTINFDVVDLPINPGFTYNSVCEGNTLTISANSGAGNYVYEWLGVSGFTSALANITIPNATISDTEGNYTLWVTDIASNCKSQPFTDYVEVTENPMPVGFATELGVCEGNNTSLTPSVSNNNYSYSWSGPNGFTSTDVSPVLNNVSVDNEGLYALIVQNLQTGCFSSPSLNNLNITPLPTIVLEDEVSITDGDNYTIVVTGGDNYTWSPTNNISASNSSSILFEPNPLTSNESQTYIYTVRVLDSSTGCEARDSIKINVLAQKDQIVIHDLITPDGNGQNDTWDIDFLYQGQQVDVKVFDINNQIVFDYIGSDYAGNKWNGYFKNDAGHQLPDGAYWYRLEIQSNEKSRIYSGPISILTGK